MKLAALLPRSLRFHRRSHIGLLIGSALAAAILTGALLVGESARLGLRQIARQRLGAIHFYAGSGDRFFRQDLAGRAATTLQAPVVPILRLRGTARLDDNTASPSQVNRIQVLGITPDFRQLAGDGRILPEKDAFPLADDQVALNRRLADELGVQVGDEIALRIAKPAFLPRDAPLSSRQQQLSVRLPVKIGHIIPDSLLGNFSLEANQVVPRNAFVNLAWLQKKMDYPEKANILLIGQNRFSTLDSDTVNRALGRVWQPADLGLSIRSGAPPDILQLESDRVFLESAITEAAMTAGAASNATPVGTLAYLVNAIHKDDGPTRRSTPYSFVLAATPSDDSSLSPVPDNLKDNEVIINRWLADQIGATPGDTVTVTYLELRDSGRFSETARPFVVHTIREMESLARERALMPVFPGLSDVDSCKDWDIGMPMDDKLLNDKANEEYWNTHRQTPKAFFTWRTGQSLWANRFGNATAVRYPAGTDIAPRILAGLQSAITPAGLGLGAVPVRQLADAAVTNATDLGGLFLGMSFFLVMAALMLTGLLFSFAIARRAEEMGILLTLGYTRRQVRTMLLTEAGIVALIGSTLGAGLGILYALTLTWAVNRLWPAAVAGLIIPLAITIPALVSGALGGFVISVTTAIFTSRRQLRYAPSELLRADFTLARPHSAGRSPRLRDLVMALLAAVGALICTAYAWASHTANPAAPFFAAGALSLVAGISLVHRMLHPPTALAIAAPLSSLFALATRNTRRRPARSAAVAGMLAAGCFLVLAVSSMRTDLSRNADQPGSATGGFELWVETTIPIPDDPGTPTGRKKLDLREALWPADISLLRIKVHDGDDASCFNLNRAPAPRLLAVASSDMAERRAFLPPSVGPDMWDLLDKSQPDGAIPALAGDGNTLMWGLGRKASPTTGDVLHYRDERGRDVRVRLVGALPLPLSIFQGALLVSASQFTKAFPSEEGYRLFLVNTPSDRIAPAAQQLSEALDKYGADVQPTVQRLKDFHSVEEAYLVMFRVLGGLGLLLGTAGLAVIVFRNVLERRTEFATLRAMGYAASAIRLILILEHAGLLFAGAGVGLLAALVAALPALLTPGHDLSPASLAAVPAALFLAGLLWITLASILATRARLVSALRND